MPGWLSLCPRVLGLFLEEQCNTHLAPLASRARYKSKTQKLVTQESPKMKVPGLLGLQFGTDPKLSLSHSGG